MLRPYTAFTERDAQRLQILTQQYPERSQQIQETLTQLPPEQPTVMLWFANADQRQLAHILACKHSFYSKKVPVQADSYTAMCSRCRWELKSDPDDDRYHMWGGDTYCCPLCDGACPNGCKEWYAVSGGGKYRWVWRGHVLFSRQPLKLGRRARRRRNRLKYSLRVVEYIQ